MRFYEFAKLKHIKPLNPSQLRVRNLKHNVERSRNALRAEKDSQKRKKELERQRKQIQAR
jgi:hypothetical protein